MKLHPSLLLNIVVVTLAALTVSPAADVYWTNTAGGLWSLAANWSPNARPTAADDVFITGAGSCTVTQDISAAVASLTLGDGTAAPTLTNAAPTLTLAGPSLVRSGAVFALGGGTLAGDGPLVIEGVGLWTDGQTASSARLAVGSGGVLQIVGSATKILRGVLTNAGLVRLGEGALAFCAGTVANVAGATFELLDDQPLYLAAYCGPSLFHNAGVLRKTGGGGTNQFVAVPVANTGTIEVQGGWITFWGGSRFETGTRLIGAGTNLLNQGNVTFDGTLVSSNAELAAGATLFGTNTLQGTMWWTGGNIHSSARMLVAEGGQLEITGPAVKLLGGTLGNAGLVRMTEAGALGFCAGTVENLPGGVFELQNDQLLYLGSYCGPSLFWNAGVLRKASGGGTNRFLSVPVANAGTVEVQSGWISFSGNSRFSTGTRLVGTGTNLFSDGNVWFDGTIVSGNAELALGAALQGTNTLHGALRWTGGDLGASACLTVASDGQLEITASATKLLRGVLRNEGFVRLTGASALALCGGSVHNSAAGVFELQNDGTVFQGSYCPASGFFNDGSLRKTGGTGTNLFQGVPLFNTGTIEVQGGWIGFASGSRFSTGTRLLGAGTNLLSDGTVWFDGPIVSSNAELAAGAALQGTNTLQGSLWWTGGDVGSSASVTVAGGSQLEIAGPATKLLRGSLTNEGVVRLAGASALALCGGTVRNTTAGVFDLQNDGAVFQWSFCGASVFFNDGLLRKTGGIGTNLFWGVPVLNTGAVEAQTGCLSLGGDSRFENGTRLLGAGTNLLERGTLWFNGTVVSSNTELVAGATLEGTPTLHGSLRWTGGDLGASASVTVASDGQLEITGPATKILRGRLRNEGSVRLTGAGALALCGGTVRNAAAGVFELQNDGAVFQWSFCAASVFFNDGLLRKTGGAGTNLFWSVPVINTGTVEAQSGCVMFDGGFTQTAGRTRLAGGNIGSLYYTLAFQGGVLSGAGQVFANVDTAADVSPGSSFGALTIRGTCTHRGSLNVELGGLTPGAQHDRLNVTGAAGLRGGLNVLLAPGYRPNEGDIFEVLTFGSRSGAIGRFGGLNLGGGKYLTPLYGPTNLVLVTTNGPTNLHQLVLAPAGEGRVLLRFTCEPGTSYSLQACTHLTNDWTTLWTTNSPVGVLEFMDADVPNHPYRFYRAAEAP